MDDHLLRIFQGELRTQCQFIIIGAQIVNSNLPRTDPATKQITGSGGVVWFGLQGILISASNASKLLWGSRQEPVVEARRPLRESVEIDDSSPLSSRRLRNDFEHFDERVEEWSGKSRDRNYIGRVIGPPGMIVVNDRDPTDKFGHFDPSTATVTFWERSADLNAIVAEAERIFARLEVIQRQRPGPPTPSP